MHQPGPEQQRLGKIATESAAKCLPILRGPAQPEAADRIGVEPARLQVVAGATAGRPPQTGLVKGGGGFEGFEQRLLPLRPFAFLWCRLRHREPGFAGKFFDCFEEIEVVGAHGKTDRVAMCAAAEAVKKILVIDDVEGRRFLVMKRAEPAMFAPAPGELDPPADQARQRNPIA